MKATNRLTLGMAVLALAAGLTACGSSSKHAATTTTTKTATPTGSPIKVGLICSCSGPFGTNVAAGGDVGKAWANEVNASGGIDGHPVQLTFLDDASNPGTSTSDVQTLISDHVAVILDDTILDAVWANAAANANIPVVGGNFSSTPFYTSPDFFPSGQTNDSITYSNIAVAKLAGGTNVGNLYCAEAAQCQQSVPLMKTAGTQLGVPDVYNASVAFSAPNYTAQCVAAQQQKVTSIFIGDSAATIIRIASDCDKQGYDPIYVTEGTGFALSMATAAGLKDHLWSDYPILPFWDTNSPAVQAMNTAVDRYYPGLRTNNDVWSEYAAQTWTAGLLIEDGVKGSNVGTAGTVTAATMTQGLDTISNDTLNGWSPPLTFTAGQPHKVDCWFVARVQGGTPSLLNGGNKTCQSGSST